MCSTEETGEPRCCQCFGFMVLAVSNDDQSSWKLQSPYQEPLSRTQGDPGPLFGELRSATGAVNLPYQINKMTWSICYRFKALRQPYVCVRTPTEPMKSTTLFENLLPGGGRTSVPVNYLLSASPCFQIHPPQCALK